MKVGYDPICNLFICKLWLLISIFLFYEMARASAEEGFLFFKVEEFTAMNPARPDFTAMFLTGPHFPAPGGRTISTT